MDDEFRRRSGAPDRPLQAIVTRLGEHEAGRDRPMRRIAGMSARIDRLSIPSPADEDVMTSPDARSRRVAKIEAALRGFNA